MRMLNARPTGVKRLSTMTQPAVPDARIAHRIPVVDKMMDLLALLERRRSGASLRDLLAQLQLPRTTVYRLLNSLQLHGLVRRGPDGTYRLGTRLLTLAAGVVGDAQDYDLSTVALPLLRRLSSQTGEASKISVVDGDELLVLAAAAGTRDYALTVIPGQRIPLHVGAAGKVLLAHMPEDQLETRLARPLAAFTSRTLIDAPRLGRELAKIRRQGWAQDRGEHSASIHAFAAPIMDRAGRVVGALSVPFLAGTEPRRMEEIRVAVIAMAAAITAALSAPARASAPA
jgi:DNA-binding IclR family transcriptional regulator